MLYFLAGSRGAFWGGGRSFPSGHSLAAFAAAAAVTGETSQWWPGMRWIIGPTLFGGAALTGSLKFTAIRATVIAGRKGL